MQTDPSNENPATTSSSEPAAAPTPAAVPATPSLTAAAPAAVASTTDPKSVEIPDNWKSALPDEFQSEPSMAHIKDIHGLAKSYIHAQKHMGANKMPVPGDNSTPEEWRMAFEKMGLPADKAEYKVEAGKETLLDAKVVDQFKEKAFELGVLPKQAQQILDWFDGATKDGTEQVGALQEAQKQEKVRALHKEWGAAYDKNLGTAKMALQYFNDPEISEFLNTSGLHDHPSMLKVFAKFGEVLKEDGLIAEDANVNSSALTPDLAKNKINEIRGDTSHPYHNSQHPSHRAATEEMRKLYGFANPDLAQPL